VTAKIVYVVSLFVLLCIVTYPLIVELESSHVKIKLDTSALSDVKSSIKIEVTLEIVELLNAMFPAPGSFNVVVVLKLYNNPPLLP